MAGAPPPAHEFHVPGCTHCDLDMATRPCLPAAIAISTVLEGAMLYIFTNMACTSRGWEELEQGHVIALGVWPVFLSCRSEMRPVKQHKVVRAYCVSLRHRGYPPQGHKGPSTRQPQALQNGDMNPLVLRGEVIQQDNACFLLISVHGSRVDCFYKRVTHFDSFCWRTVIPQGSIQPPRAGTS